MREAWERIEEEIDFFRTRARRLTVAECEGDVLLQEQVRSVCKLVANVLGYRFKYLQSVPWVFVRADTPRGARAFIEQAESRASCDHDPLTVFLYKSHKDALHAVRDGGEVTMALAEAVSAYNDTPLDEGAGEGYHRSTHHARARAANAKNPY